jgi:4-amino-4-deoxy-L-arabinose transferase-like glycosyltransferase
MRPELRLIKGHGEVTESQLIIIIGHVNLLGRFKVLNVIRKLIERLWDKLLVICGVFFVLGPTSPWNMPLTYRDSGVFLYAGWRILNGEIPYRDFWDHKPPVIFYINALGQLITNHSRWGVWLLEFLVVCLAAYIGFRLVRKFLDTYPAVFSLFLWLLTLAFVIEGGNLTTEYALLFQFAALWMIYDSDKPGFPNWRWFLVGILGGLAFFTKQTTIGIWIAIVLYLTIQRLYSRQAKHWIKEIVIIAAGGLMICAGVVMFFALNGALERFWSAAFQFNFVYSSSIGGIGDRLKPILEGLGDLKGVGIFQFAMIGYVIGLFVFFKKNILRDGLPLLAVGLIALPVEWILISIQGRIVSHYLTTLLPVLALFTGITFWVLFSWVSSWKPSKLVQLLFLFGMMGIFIWGTYAAYKRQILTYREVNDSSTIDYIKDTSSPEDPILILGAEAFINYFSQRKSPTRFVYQYPLHEEGYVSEAMILEFLTDIIDSQNTLILSPGNSSSLVFNFPIQTEAIDELIEKLQTQYQAVDNINGLTIFRRIENNN